VLELRDVSVAYGKIRALKGVSLTVREGEVVTLIGSNGAGKSTLLRATAGLIPHQGSIVFDGVPLDRVPGHRVARRGLRLVPESRGLLTRMRVSENLLMGTYAGVPPGPGGPPDLERVLDRFPVLRERWDQFAGTLSGGEQQQLAIARALVGRPRLLMLDEPSLGLAPLLVKEIFHIIRQLKADGATILLVEQNAKQALQVADRGYILETGEIALEGPASELLDGEAVQRAYLGVKR
jgi:branched-chain amino acid transport system ATP-binding protein